MKISSPLLVFVPDTDTFLAHTLFLAEHSADAEAGGSEAYNAKRKKAS